MSYSDDYNASRPLQGLKAAGACVGLHIALCALLGCLLVVIDKPNSMIVVLSAYVLIGWLPLAVWVYPYMKKKLE